MSVRAKFRCQSVTTYAETPGYYQADVALTPVTCDEVPENQRFHEATPAGKIELSITNRDAADAFKPGGEYYVDFTPVPSEE